MSIARLFTQSVDVETYLGDGAYGPTFATSTAVACYIEDSIKQVRNAAGEEVVSSGRVFCAVSAAPDVPATAGQFSVGSRVAVNGRQSFVVSVNRNDQAGPPRVHHLVVNLT